MRVGIIGGGQLGMMLCEALKKYDQYVICLDPNSKCSASYVCDEVIVSGYSDIAGLSELASKCDVITYEFENISASGLEFLLSENKIPQGIKQLYDSQNRLREKNNALNNGLTPAKFMAAYNKDDILKAKSVFGYPFVVKTTTLGYDGHGQVVCRCDSDLDEAYKLLDTECIVEEFVKYDYEASIICVRDKSRAVCLPPSYNIHKDGILDLSIAGMIDEGVSNKMKDLTIKFMENCGYYGILAIEYFVCGEDIYFNEMAPRPHNSGHYSIEGCSSSQYDLLARFLIGLELEEPKLLSNTVMKNILGFDYDSIKDIKSGYVHDYFKEGVKPKRKMAHVTFVNTSLDEYKLNYKKLFK